LFGVATEIENLLRNENGKSKIEKEKKSDPVMDHCSLKSPWPTFKDFPDKYACDSLM
jgi:hypothetical protein